TAGQGSAFGLALQGRNLFWATAASILEERTDGSGLTALQPSTLPPSAASWWPAESNAKDVLATNDGLLQGAASFATAQVGQGFVFGSDADGVVIPASPNLNIQSYGFTCALWMKGIKNQPQSATTLFE